MRDQLLNQSIRLISLRWLATLAITLMLAFTSVAHAQQDAGTIHGTVTDQQGERLPGVVVSASSPNIVGTRTEVTNAEGEYRIRPLPPGSYTVTATFSGFKTQKRDNIRVGLGESVEVDFVLELAEIEQ